MEGTTEVFTAESSSDLIASIVGVVLPLELGADGCEVETLAPAEGCGGGGGFGGADIAYVGEPALVSPGLDETKHTDEGKRKLNLLRYLYLFDPNFHRV